MGWVGNATPLPFYPGEETKYQLDRAARGRGPLWICAESLASHWYQCWWTGGTYDANRFLHRVIKLYVHKDPLLGRFLAIQTLPITRKDSFLYESRNRRKCWGMKKPTFLCRGFLFHVSEKQPRNGICCSSSLPNPFFSIYFLWLTLVPVSVELYEDLIMPALLCEP